MAARDLETFDFVIIGAGSAGSVLANRLSADGHNTVLVLEFGGSDRSMLIQMPAALSIPMNMARYNWQYETEPEPHLSGRRLHCPRGKVIGGSSSINGLVYVRATRLISSGGRRRARKAGAIGTFFPISSVPRRDRRAGTPGAAVPVPLRPAMAELKTRSTRLLWKLRSRLAIPLRMTSTGSSRRALAAWT
jgi:hypothetical protein